MFEQPSKDLTPEERKKIVRAQTILYVVMFSFILAPFVFWFFFKRQ